MGNPWRGEVDLVLNGERKSMRLTLGALAELEAEIGAGGLLELVQRFESGAVTSRDIASVIVAGLRGGGASVTASDMLTAEIEGGPLAASKAAAQLLVRAFVVPDDEQS